MSGCGNQGQIHPFWKLTVRYSTHLRIRKELWNLASNRSFCSSKRGWTLYFIRFSNSATFCITCFKFCCWEKVKSSSSFMVWLSVKSYSKKNKHKKTLANWEGSIPLGCLMAASAFATTLPGKAGWYGQYPCLDACTDFDSVSSGCQQAWEIQSLANRNRIGFLLETVWVSSLQIGYIQSASPQTSWRARAQYWSRNSDAGAVASKPQVAPMRPCAMRVFIESQSVTAAFHLALSDF